MNARNRLFLALGACGGDVESVSLLGKCALALESLTTQPSRPEGWTEVLKPQHSNTSNPLLKEPIQTLYTRILLPYNLASTTRMKHKHHHNDNGVTAARARSRSRATATETHHRRTTETENEHQQLTTRATTHFINTILNTNTTAAITTTPQRDSFDRGECGLPDSVVWCQQCTDYFCAPCFLLSLLAQLYRVTQQYGLHSKAAFIFRQLLSTPCPIQPCKQILILL